MMTTPMLNELVEKIVVHAPEKHNVKRHMRVDIVFRFIGNFAMPQTDTASSEETQGMHRMKTLAGKATA